MDRLFFLKESRIRFAWLQIEVLVSYQMLNLRIMIVELTYITFMYAYSNANGVIKIDLFRD